MRTSWIIQVGVKSSDKCPYKRQKSQKRRRLCEDRSRDWSDAAKEAKECLQPPEAGRVKEGLSSKGSPRAFGGLQTNDTLILFIFFIFYFIWPRHAACGILVPRPEAEPVPSATKARRPNRWTRPLENSRHLDF